MSNAVHRRKSVAVLVSGGDCQVVNTVLATFMKNAQRYSLYFVINGYEGVYSRNMLRVSTENGCAVLESTLLKGLFPYDAGSVIGTSRFASLTDRIRECIGSILAEQIDHIVVLGGEGSIKGAHLFPSTYTVPCSIDNNTHSSYSLGMLTAVQQAVEYIQKVNASNRAICKNAVYEVMGNRNGSIAILTYFATYSDYLLLNEQMDDLACCKSYSITAEDVMSDLAINRNRTVIASEKNTQCDINRFKTENTRTIVVGFVQRGGSPTYTDRRLGVCSAYSVINDITSNPCTALNRDVFIGRHLHVRLDERQHYTNRQQNSIFTGYLTRLVLNHDHMPNVSGHITIIVRKNMPLSLDNINQFIDHYRLREKTTIITLEKNECVEKYAMLENAIVLGNQQDILRLKRGVVIPTDKIKKIDGFVGKETVLNGYLSVIDNIIQRNENSSYLIKCKKWIVKEIVKVYDYYIGNKNATTCITVGKMDRLDGCNIILSSKNIKGTKIVKPPIYYIDSALDRIYLRISLLVALEKNNGIVCIRNNKVEFVSFCGNC